MVVFILQIPLLKENLNKLIETVVGTFIWCSYVKYIKVQHTKKPKQKKVNKNNAYHAQN